MDFPGTLLATTQPVEYLESVVVLRQSAKVGFAIVENLEVTEGSTVSGADRCFSSDCAPGLDLRFNLVQGAAHCDWFQTVRGHAKIRCRIFRLGLCEGMSSCGAKGDFEFGATPQSG